MTPERFVEKWRASSLKERSAAQEHFLDLCALLDEPTPAQADPDGSWYTFEKGASKTGGGDGYADVWRRGCFAWEYKGKHKDLHSAFAQLQRYAIALENPPLLIVSDMETIRLHTNFTNTVQQIHEITLEDLLLQDKRRMLKRVFEDPASFKPGTTREQLTEDVARRFAGLAHSLRKRGYEPHRVAHFVNKVVLCLFAEDIDILPTKIFTRLLENASRHPDKFCELAGGLFAAMKDGGNFGIEVIDWFNGGLFDDADVLPLFKPEIDELLKASKLDWSNIEPSIFGTLFERGLDPDKRSQLGAHYTDKESIMRIVGPVILDPLRGEWEQTKVRVDALISASKQESKRTTATRLYNGARQQYLKFLDRLRTVRVLDPACGSGNFLYLALRGLKDLEKHVIEDASELGFPQSFPQIDPSAVLGIELNAYAAELARVTVWIGQIQWMLRNNFNLSKTPILKKLDQIDCRDAVLNADGFEADWPKVDFIVGNPPFLGGQKMLSELGADYMNHLRAMFQDRIPGGADLVTYWFEKARYQIDQGEAKRAGLVATNSIRGGQNRKVLDRIRETCVVFSAWSDEPWILEGAAVRVSIVCFAAREEAAELPVVLDDKPVIEIFADLTGRATGNISVDVTKAKRLRENAHVAFQGPVKVGKFDIAGVLARQWLTLPANANGRPNADVIRPWSNGMDVTRRLSDTWIIDFGADTPEAVAAYYEEPFRWVLKEIKPKRDENRDEARKQKWWLLGRSGNDLRKALEALPRYILTPRVSKHRLFVWREKAVLPDSAVVAIARDDDATFGILHSRFHELWTLRMCTWLGVGNDPRYTPGTTFETFPFPEHLSPNVSAHEFALSAHAVAIADAARNLDYLVTHRKNRDAQPEFPRMSANPTQH